jgi:hypothetical protein
MGEWRYSSTILDLGTRWRWVVSFTPRPLYPRLPLDGNLGGPLNRCGSYGEERNLAPAGNWTPAVQTVARRYTDWVISAPHLCTCTYIHSGGRKLCLTVIGNNKLRVCSGKQMMVVEYTSSETYTWLSVVRSSFTVIKLSRKPKHLRKKCVRCKICGSFFPTTFVRNIYR